MIIILDFGGQYTHLIKTCLEKYGYGASILAADIKFSEIPSTLRSDFLEGVIFSGAPSSVSDNLINFDPEWMNCGVPILGICYGHQLIVHETGGSVKKTQSEFGQSLLVIKKKDPLFTDIPAKLSVWMSHGDSVDKLPREYEILAKSDYSTVAGFKHSKLKIYGLQFHPEVSHTQYGEKILVNFCEKICKAKIGKPWTVRDFIKDSKDQIKKTVKESKVILGISGGVDSLTLSKLLRISLAKKQLLAVYVDSGLMPDETEQEVVEFCKSNDIDLKIVNAKERFFLCLKDVVNPTEKGKRIGKEFIDIFEELSDKYSCSYLAQGTIWSDVIESGVTKFSSQIKPHHNVGGLPLDMKIKLLEPLRELFKNQVREIAKELNLPDWVVSRKVFPGPGFAIRVEGEVTEEKVSVVRKATKIIEEEISRSKIGDKIWMGFAILVNVPSLGVRGDQRFENEQAIVVRVVESKNSMTANFSRNVLPYLENMSKRIVDETPIGRVVYDITDKPPATIEWQ